MKIENFKIMKLNTNKIWGITFDRQISFSEKDVTVNFSNIMEDDEYFVTVYSWGGWNTMRFPCSNNINLYRLAKLIINIFLNIDNQQIRSKIINNDAEFKIIITDCLNNL